MLPLRIVASIAVGILFSGNLFAETVYESGFLGETGIPFLSPVPGTGVDPNVYVGVRFEVDDPVLTTRIGGHFVGHPFNLSNEFFGALIQLEGETDFPDSEDFSSEDVLGVTTLIFPNPSDEVFGKLSATLDPGWYAVVFGSGLFGKSAVGATLRNGLDDGPQTYIAWQPGTEWRELGSFFDNHRFVVEGRIIPEPSTGSLTFLSLAFLSWCVRPQHRTRA